ncbi:MAG: cobalamin-binding protein [Candidatus Lokiarchaeota archaeon]|nr:cobalamin-binding protein [Candidatus Lokiarchaeota archaeon]
MEDINKFISITEAVLDGNSYDIEELVQSSLDSGNDPHELFSAMIAGLEQCGKLFEKKEFFLPDMMMASETFTKGMEILEPYLAQISIESTGKVLLGTVAGDVHDIGKNLVGFLLKSAGFEVIDIGTDIDTKRFIQAVKKYQPDILGMSALLTTTMQGMEDVIKLMDEEGLREKTKVIIGGGPVSKHFAEHIGADAYATDAVEGVNKVKELLGL